MITEPGQQEVTIMASRKLLFLKSDASRVWKVANARSLSTVLELFSVEACGMVSSKKRMNLQTVKRLGMLPH